jgi:hypothetical protein
MTSGIRILTLTLAAIVGTGSAAHAQAQAAGSSKGTVAWTIAGAGGGFSIGLWAGLTKFDDSINSDRKVWTAAIAGAAVGAVAGYFIGRSRASGSRPSSPALVRPTLPAPQVTWPRNIGAARYIVGAAHGVS